MICRTCNDSHGMWSSALERYVPCTRCPTPCAGCAYKRTGAYCAETPCMCDCHLEQPRWRCTALMVNGLRHTRDGLSENGLVSWIDQVALELARFGGISGYYRHELNVPDGVAVPPPREPGPINREPLIPTALRVRTGNVVAFYPRSVTYKDSI